MPESTLPEISHAILPRQGESVSGDACAVWNDGQRLVLLLADGLGHGAEAGAAAQKAIDCVSRYRAEDCNSLFARCDQALQGTRGAAMALAILDRSCGVVELAAVGNIRTVLVPVRGRDRRFGAARGIVGAGYTALAPERFALTEGDVLALYSDGLPELAPLASHLQNVQSFETLAERLVRQWSRGLDDACLLLYRHKPPC